jgi:hypothetical protein
LSTFDLAFTATIARVPRRDKRRKHPTPTLSDLLGASGDYLGLALARRLMSVLEHVVGELREVCRLVLGRCVLDRA